VFPDRTADRDHPDPSRRHTTMPVTRERRLNPDLQEQE
jgi:hypothetical protein